MIIRLLDQEPSDGERYSHAAGILEAIARAERAQVAWKVTQAAREAYRRAQIHVHEDQLELGQHGGSFEFQFWGDLYPDEEERISQWHDAQ
jgi:hypothetical protein